MDCGGGAGAAFESADYIELDLEGFDGIFEKIRAGGVAFGVSRVNRAKICEKPAQKLLYCGGNAKGAGGG